MDYETAMNMIRAGQMLPAKQTINLASENLKMVSDKSRDSPVVSEKSRDSPVRSSSVFAASVEPASFFCLSVDGVE